MLTLLKFRSIVEQLASVGVLLRKVSYYPHMPWDSDRGLTFPDFVSFFRMFS